ncbi:MAG: ParB/RepB/Spo0J family partition protein [Clostridia bacterium]|nr:ParB/RepB/Spo0J family partition protein [Clostridia bacterium]
MKNDVFVALSQKSEKRSETSVKGLTEMFGLSDDIKVIMLPISSLREKANHPFKVVTDDKLNALAESIKANGLMEPIIVRIIQDGTYEILAGHRRTRATQLNGETEIKAIVIKADDELANRIMISTNFQQRDSYLPSEIAKSYLIRYNDLKNRKKAKDENSNGWNSEDKIDRIMEKEFSTSKSKVYMYLRINHLVQELLDVLDGRRLNLKIAVELSYLTEEEQRLVNELVYKQRLYKLDLKKAVRIKQESSNKPIEESEMHKLLSDKPKSFSVEGITFSSAEIEEYKSKFKDETHMKNSIIEFLKNY